MFSNFSDKNAKRSSTGNSSAAFCAPAKTYLYISVFAFAILGFQFAFRLNSLSLEDVVCNGKCSNTNLFIFVVVEIAAVLFWTWILNIICKDGYPSVAWFLVIAPFALIIASAITQQSVLI